MSLIKDIHILENMVLYCKDVEDAITEFNITKERFFESRIRKNAVCQPIFQIGEMVTKFSDEFIDENQDIIWHEIRGMRNIIAHEYGTASLEEIWETVQDGLPMLKSFCINYLNEHMPGWEHEYNLEEYIHSNAPKEEAQIEEQEFGLTMQ